jgi:DNA polymerase-3 subunit beta
MLLSKSSPPRWVLPLVAFTSNNDPNKPGPVLLTSHGSKEKTDSDTYRYLLQPNLLNR